MKCLLLSAGYGSRLGELTKNKPKPLVDLDGKPLIEHLVTRLAMHGITSLIVNLHYLPELIPGYLHERALYYYEPRLLGHRKTIQALRGWLTDADFMVINADTITDLDYTDMRAFHKRHMPCITTAMDEHRATGTWIYSKDVFERSLPIIPYRRDFSWKDAGTPERLTELREEAAVT